MIEERRLAYARIFDSPDGRVLLFDLARFCRGYSTPFDPDPRIHALLTGRHEVFWRIMEHTRLDPDVLFKLYMMKQTERVSV